jgi:heterodisulfide reductase subunit C
VAAVTKLPAIFPSEEFLTERTDLRGGERVVTCYACGICSGSSPHSGTWNVALATLCT